MSSLIQKANNSNYIGVSERRSQWKYDWYVTSRPETVSGSHGNTSSENGRGSESDTSRHTYKFKTWLKSEGLAPDGSDDIEHSDLFDLSAYSTTSGNGISSGAPRPTGEGARNNSLTVEDIRGAVGNSESMLALSSTGTSAPRAGDKGEVASSKPDAVETQEKPVETTEADQQAGNKDAEGDLAME